MHDKILDLVVFSQEGMPLWFRGMHVVGTPRYLTMGYNMLLKPLLSKEVTVGTQMKVFCVRACHSETSFPG